jgi:hypothetical protein
MDSCRSSLDFISPEILQPPLCQGSSRRQCKLKNLGLLGLDDHPELRPDPAGKRKRPAKLRKLLSKIIYHCDLDNLFLDNSAAAKYNETRKRKRTEAAAKIVARGHSKAFNRSRRVSFAPRPPPPLPDNRFEFAWIRCNACFRRPSTTAVVCRECHQGGHV